MEVRAHDCRSCNKNFFRKNSSDAPTQAAALQASPEFNPFGTTNDSSTNPFGDDADDDVITGNAGDAVVSKKKDTQPSNPFGDESSSNPFGDDVDEENNGSNPFGEPDSDPVPSNPFGDPEEEEFDASNPFA